MGHQVREQLHVKMKVRMTRLKVNSKTPCYESNESDSYLQVLLVCLDHRELKAPLDHEGTLGLLVSMPQH